MAMCTFLFFTALNVTLLYRQLVRDDFVRVRELLRGEIYFSLYLYIAESDLVVPMLYQMQAYIASVFFRARSQIVS